MSKYFPFDPTEEQSLFIKTDCVESLYTGEQGYGKTTAILMSLLNDVSSHDRWECVYFGSSREKTEKAMKTVAEWASGHDNLVCDGRRIYFPNGSRFLFLTVDPGTIPEGICGLEIQSAGIDDIHLHEDYSYLYLFSRIRRKDPGIQNNPKLRSACPADSIPKWLRKRVDEPCKHGFMMVEAK